MIQERKMGGLHPLLFNFQQAAPHWWAILGALWFKCLSTGQKCFIQHILLKKPDKYWNRRVIRLWRSPGDGWGQHRKGYPRGLQRFHSASRLQLFQKCRCCARCSLVFKFPRCRILAWLRHRWAAAKQHYPDLDIKQKSPWSRRCF